LWGFLQFLKPEFTYKRIWGPHAAHTPPILIGNSIIYLFLFDDLQPSVREDLQALPANILPFP
jgi:hypothetical protein